jgi:hypothetical protein
MDLRRLLHPRTIAVVGATARHDSYAGQTLRVLRGLRGAAVLTGGPGRPALDVAAAARLAARSGELLLERGLILLELNPVLVYERGAVAVDALAAGPGGCHRSGPGRARPLAHDS